MKNILNTLLLIFIVLGGVGGFMYSLIIFVVIDYVTGLMVAVLERRLSSEVGFRGVFKKF